MAKHTQTIRRQIADEFARVCFNHFVGLALKELKATHPFLTRFLGSFAMSITICWSKN